MQHTLSWRQHAPCHSLRLFFSLAALCPAPSTTAHLPSPASLPAIRQVDSACCVRSFALCSGALLFRFCAAADGKPPSAAALDTTGRRLLLGGEVRARARSLASSDASAHSLHAPAARAARMRARSARLLGCATQRTRLPKPTSPLPHSLPPNPPGWRRHQDGWLTVYNFSSGQRLAQCAPPPAQTAAPAPAAKRAVAALAAATVASTATAGEGDAGVASRLDGEHRPATAGRPATVPLRFGAPASPGGGPRSHFSGSALSGGEGARRPVTAAADGMPARDGQAEARATALRLVERRLQARGQGGPLGAARRGWQKLHLTPRAHAPCRAAAATPAVAAR